jgi:ParB/RepB/Spo0J family partition protein
MRTCETGNIDLKYENCRLKDEKREKELLLSIAERGVEEGIFGVEDGNNFVLLDGFKRLRCAKKLGILTIPIVSHNGKEVEGVIQFLRQTQKRNLTFFEEAALIDQLRTGHGLNLSEIAKQLGKSTGWVSIRVGVLSEMPVSVHEAILSGKFPYRAYLYSLRRFTRVKGISKKEISEFVDLVSGKGLSVRVIEETAKNYFQGPPEIREQMKRGNFEWTLSQLDKKEEKNIFNDIERRVLEELQYADSLMQRIPHDLRDARLKQESFFMQAYIWAENILKKMQRFIEGIEEFYDKRRKT